MQGMLDFGDQGVLGALSLLSLLQTCPLQGEHSCLCTTTWRLSLFRPQLWLSWPLRWWALFTGHLQKLCFGKLKNRKLIRALASENIRQKAFCWNGG